MDWLVKNAISRDVERQHLNKILQDIRTAIDTINTKFSTSQLNDDYIRTVVAGMISGGRNTGIIATYNPQSKAIDISLRQFTIALTGDVTGSGLVTGNGNVNITTTVSDSLRGIGEAPLDGLAYWRISGAWGQVPIALQYAEAFSPPGLVYIDEDGFWYASTLVAGDNIVIDYTDPTQIVITGTSSGGVLPVVTGEVPPVFVYFDDGSLLIAPAEY